MPRTLICLWGLLAVAQAFPASYQSAIVKRDGKDLLPEYDFIIVGGGTAGLTVADRLSEDPKKTVLVIEYGRIAVDDSFMPPFNTPAAEFLYNLTSVPQPNANNRVFPVPNGAVVGGGSAVNGQIFFRGSKEDHDNWSLLGNPGWDWDSVLPYYKKSHSFNPPPQHIQDEYGMTFDLSAYGNTTPIYMSMPGYQYPGQKYEWKAWSERDGMVVQKEHGKGNAYGLIWIPSSYDPSRAYNRSFSGLGHYQYVQPRQNYHLLPLHRGLKVNFKKHDLTQKAVSIQVKPRFGDGATFDVKAKQEIILSASATRTPVILQLSGIGPKKVVEEAGIKSLIDLPGVGWNLQDHSHTFSLYNFTKDVWPTPTTIHTNTTFRAEALAEYKAHNTGPFTSPTISGGLLLPARSFTGSHFANLSLQLGLQAAHKYYLPDGLDPTLIAGYILQHKILLKSFLSDKSAIFEHPFQGSPRGTSILLKPFSRGSVNINPKYPFRDPIFDYRLLSNPIDLEIHVRMQQYIRKHFATSKTLSALGPVEVVPGKDRASDAELKKWLVDEENLNASNGHSCGTASMMPRHLGGVVDSNLKVYGTSHLSIADTSIIPLLVGAHTQSTAYMIGEKAADLIKFRHG